MLDTIAPLARLQRLPWSVVPLLSTALQALEPLLLCLLVSTRTPAVSAPSRPPSLARLAPIVSMACPRPVLRARSPTSRKRPRVTPATQARFQRVQLPPAPRAVLDDTVQPNSRPLALLVHAATIALKAPLLSSTFLARLVAMVPTKKLPLTNAPVLAMKVTGALPHQHPPKPTSAAPSLCTVLLALLPLFACQSATVPMVEPLRRRLRSQFALPATFASAASRALAPQARSPTPPAPHRA